MKYEQIERARNEVASHPELLCLGCDQDTPHLWNGKQGADATYFCDVCGRVRTLENPRTADEEEELNLFSGQDPSEEEDEEEAYPEEEDEEEAYPEEEDDT